MLACRNLILWQRLFMFARPLTVTIGDVVKLKLPGEA